MRSRSHRPAVDSGYLDALIQPTAWRSFYMAVLKGARNRRSTIGLSSGHCYWYDICAEDTSRD
jgi:hypothetical protein